MKYNNKTANFTQNNDNNNNIHVRISLSAHIYGGPAIVWIEQYAQTN